MSSDNRIPSLTLSALGEIDSRPPAEGRHREDYPNPYRVTAQALLAGVERTGRRANRTGPGSLRAADLVAPRTTS